MKTVYLNVKYNGRVETVDEFTRGENAPANVQQFVSYIRDMVKEYHIAGIDVYRSNRSTKDWRAN